MFQNQFLKKTKLSEQDRKTDLANNTIIKVKKQKCPVLLMLQSVPIEELHEKLYFREKIE